jgi:hypothetical protein
MDYRTVTPRIEACTEPRRAPSGFKRSDDPQDGHGRVESRENRKRSKADLDRSKTFAQQLDIVL